MMSFNAHLKQLVDSGVHSSFVGTQNTLNHLVVHGGKHGLEVFHGLIELQVPDRPVRPAVVELPTSSAAPISTSTAFRAFVAVAPPEQASHPLRLAVSGAANPIGIRVDFIDPQGEVA